MHANMPLIETLAAALGLALLLGFVASRLRLPALVGYLLAGVLIGPFTPGFVGDIHLAAQLAEIGIMLLMFGVGLHLSLDDLVSVRAIAVPGALVQMTVATLLGAGAALVWGWTPASALVFGLSLSVASTVVLLRALESRGALQTRDGHIAIGWLVVEDLAMVLVLVLLPAFFGSVDATQGHMWTAIARTLAGVVAFVALMLVVGRRLLPWMLWQVSRTGSRELFTLCVIAVAVSIAYGASALFGVSVALGAFFAGLVLQGSEFSHRAAQESLPFRDAFAVLFFVSVGMLFDPMVLLQSPLQVLTVAAIVMGGKSVVCLLLMPVLRYPLGTALTVAAGLAQVGEFSFILMSLGTSLGLLPAQATSLVVAAAMVSIALNPLVFWLAGALQRQAERHWDWARNSAQRSDPLAELPPQTGREHLSRQLVLVGYGNVGRRVAQVLTARGVPFVVVDHQRDRIERLRAAGQPAVAGDAAQPATLVQAHIADAAMLMVTVRDGVDMGAILNTARTLNPAIAVLARAPSEQEAVLLGTIGFELAVHPDQAMAGYMVERALQLLAAGAPVHQGPAQVQAKGQAQAQS